MNFNLTANLAVPSPLQNSAMVANEGCSNISDDNGQILFYTNGVTVYNRQHKVMLNGNNLSGNLSATQSCIIVPVPGNDSIYYIFTTDAVENNFVTGYRYSIVNMNKDNGNGEIVSKNILLWASCTERMTAARHANGSDVWLITNDNNSNIFRAWLITCAGLQIAPVVSKAGIVMNQHYLTNTGILKVSPDGRQLCQTHSPDFDPINYVPNFAQLFDFDNATGIVSNARTIGFPDAQISACEYSPDSKLLYLSRPYDKAIDQVESTLATAIDIMASRVTINTGTQSYFGIQLAPDKKIYLSSQPSKYVGAINNPDTKGPGCNYQQNQVLLVLSSTSGGLPTFINDLSFDPYNNFNYTILDSCTGKVQLNGYSALNGPLQWNWDFGDGSIANIQNPVHTYNPPDYPYTVKLKITSSAGCGNGVFYKSKIIKPQGLISNIDFSFNSSCNNYDVGFTNNTLYLEDSAGQFTWDFGDGSISNVINPLHTYSRLDTFDVKLNFKTTNACLDRSLTRRVNLTPFKVDASPDQTIFPGQAARINVTGTGKTYKWTPATWLSNPEIKSPVARPLEDIMYKVTVTDNTGCISEDSLI
ncbi:MAG: PKD domain-containing protein, partial [Bacteroidota bacterium]